MNDLRRMNCFLFPTKCWVLIWVSIWMLKVFFHIIRGFNSFLSRVLSSTLKLSDDVIFLLFFLTLLVTLMKHESVLAEIISDYLLFFLSYSIISLFWGVYLSFFSKLTQGRLELVTQNIIMNRWLTFAWFFRWKRFFFEMLVLL